MTEIQKLSNRVRSLANEMDALAAEIAKYPDHPWSEYTTTLTNGACNCRFMADHIVEEKSDD